MWWPVAPGFFALAGGRCAPRKNISTGKPGESGHETPCPRNILNQGGVVSGAPGQKANSLGAAAYRNDGFSLARGG